MGFSFFSFPSDFSILALTQINRKMPNPFVGNDDAADYLDYYASSSMERDAVHRLYADGCKRHREARQRAEAQLYPSRPPVVRTQEQVDEFLKRVKDAAERKQRKQLALEQQLYGPPPTAHLDPARLEKHVQHMYDEQMKRMRRHRAAAAEIRGDRPPSQRELQEREVNSKRESQWKPVATSPRRQDGKATLVYDSPRRRSASAAEKRILTSEERDEKARYFEKLSKPLRVYPKVPRTAKDGFNIYA